MKLEAKEYIISILAIELKNSSYNNIMESN